MHCPTSRCQCHDESLVTRRWTLRRGATSYASGEGGSGIDMRGLLPFDESSDEDREGVVVACGQRMDADAVALMKGF